MPGGVFVSYRRESAQHAAGRIVENLSRAFPRDLLFFDVDSIPAGENFEQALDQRLSGCEVVLVVMGPRWHDIMEERVADPEAEDYVRREVEAALNRGVPVIPILVDGADLPRRAEMPEALWPLLKRNTVRVDHETFAGDLRRLADEIRRIIDPDGAYDAATQARRWVLWLAITAVAQFAVLALHLGYYGVTAWGEQLSFERADEYVDAATWALGAVFLVGSCFCAFRALQLLATRD